MRGGCFEDLRTGPTLRDHTSRNRLRKELERIFYHISSRAGTQIVDTLGSTVAGDRCAPNEPFRLPGVQYISARVYAS